MSGTINYSYDPTQVVWTISSCVGNLIVRRGTVVRVRGIVLGSPTQLLYDIRLDSEYGTTEFSESDVFGDLISAMTEYETRLSV